MMKKALYFLFLSFAIVACDTAPSSTTDLVEIVHIDAVAPMNKTIAELEIEGMMCVQACGGKIQKELYKLAGAESVDIDFDADRPLDIAEVTYDPQQISPEQLVRCVNEIADGKLYAVKKVTVTKFSPEG